MTAHSPSGWDTILNKLADRPDLRVKVANFGVKYRLTEDLRSSAFDGDTHSTDSYYVLLKLAIFYSAIEALEQIVGKGRVVIQDESTVQEIRDTSAFQPFLKTLEGVVDSPKLKRRLETMGVEGGHDDLRPLFQSIRNGFFHPGLTAQNSTLTAHPSLRLLLLKACELGRVALDSIFTRWADSLTAAGAYARKDIESVYNLTFTDSQWQVLLEEIDRKGPLSVKDVIDEVVPNIGEYEERLASEQMDNQIDDLTGPASLEENLNDLEGEAK